MKYLDRVVDMLIGVAVVAAAVEPRVAVSTATVSVRPRRHPATFRSTYRLLFDWETQWIVALVRLAMGTHQATHLIMRRACVVGVWGLGWGGWVCGWELGVAREGRDTEGVDRHRL